MRKLAYLIFISLITLTSVSGVYADSEEQVERVQELVAQARQSLRQGDLKEAIRFYEEANREIPTPDYLFAIASLHGRIEGHCMETMRSWEIFLRECKACPRRAKGLKKLELHQKLCKVVINIKSSPSGAEISFDDQLIGQTPLSFHTVAGKHRLKWTLNGYHPHSSEVILLKGGGLAVKEAKLIPLNQSKAKESLASSTPPQPSSSEVLTASVVKSEREHQPEWPLLITGGVIASLGVAGVILAHSDIDEMNNASSAAEFAKLERSSTYQLKQGLGYTGIGIGVGLISYSLLQFKF